MGRKRGEQPSLTSSPHKTFAAANTACTFVSLVGKTVHAFDRSPPNRHSVEVLILWGHKAPLCPSLPDALVADRHPPVVNRPPAGSAGRGPVTPPGALSCLVNH